VLVTTCDSFENSTWGATAAGTCADQALRHDYVATLASTSPLRSASSAYRYFASGDESLTRAKRHELVVVIRDFGQRATAPERFKYVVVPLAEESRDIERWDFWPWRVSPRLPQCVTSDHLGSGLSAL